MTTAPARLIERFYQQVWNEGDEDTAREILHKDFIFRGSLGPEKRGPEGFVDYMHAIRAALPDFVCNIQEVLTEDKKAVARMEFVGTHGGTFFGVPPTNRKIAWSGAAFFRTNGEQITELWVLGDIDAVKRQLGLGDDPNFSSR